VIKDIVERRVNQTGVSEPVVLTQGSDRVVVELPGVTDPEAVRKLVGQTGRLDFVPLDTRERLDAYYRARRVFDQRLRAPDFEIRFLLRSGDLVMFDNCRLLHGRTGFDPAEGRRHLQGCYIDMDGPRSLYRVLRRRQAQSSEARRSA